MNIVFFEYCKKRPLYILLIVISILVGLLLSSIILSYQEKNGDIFINSITSLVTLLSLILILLTVEEMSEQRKSSYAPSLMIQNGRFFITWNPDDFDPFTYQCLGIPNFITSNQSIKSAAVMKLFNIGLGPAKFVKISLNYSADSMVDNIKKNNPNFEITLTQIEEEKILSVNSNECSYLYGDIEQPLKFEFILPTRDNDDYLEIPIPCTYLILCVIQKFLLYENIEAIPRVFPILPDIKIHMQFVDIGNNVLTKEYTLKFTSGALNLNSDNKLTNSEIIFEVI
jgi:hypothetical protein